VTRPELGLLVEQMARIRQFEFHLLDLFSKGELFGTTHTCVGQEACAASPYVWLDRETDAIFTTHRCHGHFLAYGGSMKALMAEIMGREGGVVDGIGGSQHLCEGRFFSNGVQGGGVPIAAGYAYRMKNTNSDGIVVVHIGDGTLGQGAVYETCNIISLLNLPLLLIVEHNHYAQSTDTSETTAGDVEMRFKAFGIDTDRRTAGDPLELAEHFGSVFEHVRNKGPFVQILDTHRLMAHSKGDDSRSREEIDRAWGADFLGRLLDEGDETALAAVEKAKTEVEAVYADLQQAPMAQTVGRSAFAVGDQPLFSSSRDLLGSPASVGSPPARISECLNRALVELMEEHADVMLIGEDLADPYGGAFKVSKGLSTRFPRQVFSSPISEAAIVGFGNGYALNGGKPIVEIMFGDFVTLAMDQIINQGSKMHYMYAGKVTVPLTIRLVSGGYRGYGPTHSQSLEARLCGVPGLKVVALSRRHDPAALLEAVVVREQNPTIFVENKKLYAMRPHVEPPTGFRFLPLSPADPAHYPTLAFSSTDADAGVADITLVTYGGLTDMAEQAMERLLLDEEIEFDYFILTQLSPLNLDGVIDSLRKTRRLLVVEEGPEAFGIGAEVLAQAATRLDKNGFRAARVGGKNSPVPCSRIQEEEVLPSREQIEQTALELVE
jgi:2-oxoisovalerate dehydrogenase E1 component